jgi:hypothetical protein
MLSRDAILLPLSPCGRGWLREAKTGEGSVSAERTPHPSRFARHLLPQGEKEELELHFCSVMAGLRPGHPRLLCLWEVRRGCPRQARAGRTRNERSTRPRLVRQTTQLAADRDHQHDAGGIGEIFGMMAEHLRGRTDIARPGRPDRNLAGRLLEHECGAAKQQRQ